MRLYINEKLLSLHNKYYIKNEDNQDILEISSKFLSLGAKTKINDLNGNEVAYIEQELFHLMPKYNIMINNEIICSIQKKFHIIKNDYVLSNGYKIDGDFLSHNFVVYNDKDEKIGEINRKFLTLGDQYSIDIYNENDYILILSIIVAITNDIDRAQRSAQASSN